MNTRKSSREFFDPFGRVSAAALYPEGIEGEAEKVFIEGIGNVLDS